MLSILTWTEIPTFYSIVNVIIANLAVFNSNWFMWDFLSSLGPLTRDPLYVVFGMLTPNLCSRHPSLYLSGLEKSSKISHRIDSNSESTSLVLSLLGLREPLSPTENFLITLHDVSHVAKACVALVLHKLLLLYWLICLVFWLTLLVKSESLCSVFDFSKFSLLGESMSCLENSLQILKTPKSTWGSILIFECRLGNPISVVSILECPEPLKTP